MDTSCTSCDGETSKVTEKRSEVGRKGFVAMLRNRRSAGELASQHPLGSWWVGGKNARGRDTAPKVAGNILPDFRHGARESNGHIVYVMRRGDFESNGEA